MRQKHSSKLTWIK